MIPRRRTMPVRPTHLISLRRWIAGFLFVLLALAAFDSSYSAEEAKTKSIEVAKISHSGLVDFEREILPIIKANCLACHNKTTTKADLVLESPETMVKGGESGHGLS